MSEVVLGCDDNDGKNAEWQNTVASALEKNGHTVEKLPIHPTPFGQYSYGEAGYNPKGKIGVYIMADSLVSVADLAYGGTSFKYAYFIIRMDLGKPKMSQPEHFNTSPIGMDGDCTGVCEKLVGKTYSQMNELTKDKCQCTWGRTPQEGADNLIKLMGGQTTGDENQGSGTSGNVKECLQKLLKHWDGDVECIFRGKNVYIQKVRDPEKYYSCALFEGVNVFSEGVSVTDINPNTPNHLIVEWTEGTIEFKDEKLIARFGEKRKTMTAVRKEVIEVEEDEEDDEDKKKKSDTDNDSSDSSSS